MSDLISIALATYNGGKYISEMLDSIQNQAHQNFIIHICDDGSRDDTLEVIQTHSLYEQNKIYIHETDGGNGALKNFRRTIKHCVSRYIALCDQDDFWLPEKLSTLLDQMKAEESVSPGPKLIFSDLEIVGPNLECLYPSFFSISGKNSNCRDPRDFIFSNHIPGCAMLFNAQLKELFEPIPDDIRMHDWWIAITAAAFGHIIFVPQSLIQYRQHGLNTIGAAGMIHPKVRPLQLFKNTVTVVQRSQLLQHRFLISFDSLVKSNEYQEPKTVDFMKFISRKMGVMHRLSYLADMRSGENKIISFFAKWFV